jgi:hypothetical protein
MYESKIRYSFGNAFCFIVVRSQKQFANFYWKKEIRTSQYAELEMHSSLQKATTPHHWCPRTVLEVSSPLLVHPERYVIKFQHPASRCIGTETSKLLQNFKMPVFLQVDQGGNNSFGTHS